MLRFLNYRLMNKQKMRKIRKEIQKIIPLWAMRLASSKVFTRTSYSQCGEDLLVVMALSLIKGNVPFSYLDIGANDPYLLSNTALLYKKRGHGFLVEPNPELAKRLKYGRGNRDQVLQCGVSFSDEDESELFIMDAHVLSTFSKEEAYRYVSLGHRISSTVRVPMMNINDILIMTGGVDFMNLDVEGVDEKILRIIDWNRHRPVCICVETITYETSKEPKKLQGLIDFMIAQEYMVFADTFINTIFVDRRKWRQRFYTSD